jgi:hypothetical protein
MKGARWANASRGCSSSSRCAFTPADAVHLGESEHGNILNILSMCVR